ncbi:MAG: hypothetical protein ACI9VT_003764, partial [Psychroserpens sp.]
SVALPTELSRLHQVDADIRVMIGVVQGAIYKKLLFLCRLIELTTKRVVFILCVHKSAACF